MSEFDFLRQPYSRDELVAFMRRHLGLQELAKPVQLTTPIAVVGKGTDAPRVVQLGYVETADGKKLPVFEVVVSPSTQIHRNRVLLRNLVAKQPNTRAAGAAVAVFFTEAPKDAPAAAPAAGDNWRLSFVSVRDRIVDGQIKTEETASKRFTFLLGRGAQTRTVEQRLQELRRNPTLDGFMAAFAVEPLTKEFYDALYKWYERAQKKAVFPNDEGARDHVKIALVRLLTRMLFVWFIKQKDLVPNELFDEDEMRQTIHWERPSSYYKAILQNLFFATLNQETGKRGFRQRRAGAPDGENYLAAAVYRYQDFFAAKEQKEIMDLFADIPFLNGGLFDCLDREASEEEKKAWKKGMRPAASAIRVDGFSDRDDNELSVPNELFFCDDESALGLINLLKQYHFTAVESTATDIDVALDPELLGKVFENLLADYNPETSEQARKATGSFYTPREVVSYMVDSSIKAYLCQNSDLSGGQIAALFDGQSAQDAGLGRVQTEKLIALINNMKIIDPAVGTGAFPMGILQRMTGLLAALDPDNTLWKSEQLKNLPSLQDIKTDLQTAGKIRDAEAKEEARRILMRRKQEIYDNFERMDHDYLRKLYLIQNCVYGVDIQPIAIQLCKLRFFISLTIEQQARSDGPEANFGIVALPNLETKFIAANSLLPLVGADQLFELFNQSFRTIQNELNALRQRYFRASTRREKKAIDKEMARLQKNAEQKALDPKKGFTADMIETAKKIIHWDWRNQNVFANWFDPTVQFGVESGFDIVIGNPPYRQVPKSAYSADFFPYSAGIDRGKQNMYKLFVEHSYNLARLHGVATMIVQSSLMCDQSSIGTRRLLLEKTKLQHIIEFPAQASSRENQVFSAVSQETCIYQFCKHRDHRQVFSISTGNDKQTLVNVEFTDIGSRDIAALYPRHFYFPKIHAGALSVLNRIANHGGARRLAELADISQGDINLTTEKASFSSKKSSVALMRGKHIRRYAVDYAAPDEFILPGRHKDAVAKNKRHAFLVCPEVSFPAWTDRLFFAVHDSTQEVVFGHSVNKILLKDPGQNAYMLGLLNSRLLNWIFRLTSSNNHVQQYELNELPIIEATARQQQLLTNKVGEAARAAATGGKNLPVIEADINQLVYQLYGLGDDEVAIVESPWQK